MTRHTPFPRLLRILREQAGLSVAALAKAAGLRRESIHRYEAGDREPSLVDAKRLARALKVSLAVFE